MAKAMKMVSTWLGMAGLVVLASAPVHAGEGSVTEPPVLLAQAVSTKPNPDQQHWDLIKGAGRDIAVGGSAHSAVIYLIGTKKRFDDFEVLFQRGGAPTWRPYAGGGAVRVAASGATVWAVDSSGKVLASAGFRLEVRGAPEAIDIGASGRHVAVIGRDNAVYKSSGHKWLKVPSVSATRIDVDSEGRPLVINERGDVMVHLQAANWNRVGKVPVAAVDLAVDSPGNVRMVGADGNIYAYDSGKNKWVPKTISGAFTGIGVGGGQVWAVDSYHRVYRQK